MMDINKLKVKLKIKVLSGWTDVLLIIRSENFDIEFITLWMFKMWSSHDLTFQTYTNERKWFARCIIMIKFYLIW